jgi:hypothetical protein
MDKITLAHSLSLISLTCGTHLLGSSSTSRHPPAATTPSLPLWPACRGLATASAPDGPALLGGLEVQFPNANGLPSGLEAQAPDMDGLPSGLEVCSATRASSMTVTPQVFNYCH